MKSSPTRRVLTAVAGVAALAHPARRLQRRRRRIRPTARSRSRISTQNAEAERRPRRRRSSRRSRPRTPTSRSSSRRSPAGTEGDNLIKTQARPPARWTTSSTTTRARCFQALNPDQTLVDLTDEDWVERPHRRRSTAVVSTDNGIYGAPVGHVAWPAPSSTTRRSTQSSASRSRRRGTSSSRTTRRSRLPASTPDHPDLRRHLDHPAVRARRLRQRARRGPGLGRASTRANEAQVRRRARARRASRTSRRASRRAAATRTSPRRLYDDGVAHGRDRRGRAVPDADRRRLDRSRRTTPTSSTTSASSRCPRPTPHDTALTVWLPNAIYIPKTTEGDKLEAAKKFVAFAQPEAGCEVQNTATVAQRSVRDQRVRAARRRARHGRRTCSRTSTRARRTRRSSSSPRSRDRTSRTSRSRSAPASRAAEGRRRAVRRGREEAGPAARPRGLVIAGPIC